MANVNIKLAYKDSAWFTANPTIILLIGQIVYLSQTGTYKIGDGVTQLGSLSFLGNGTQNLQQVLTNGNSTGNLLISSPNTNNYANISDSISEIRFVNPTSGNYGGVSCCDLLSKCIFDLLINT